MGAISCSEMAIMSGTGVSLGSASKKDGASACGSTRLRAALKVTRYSSSMACRGAHYGVYLAGGDNTDKRSACMQWSTCNLQNRSAGLHRLPRSGRATGAFL